MEESISTSIREHGLVPNPSTSTPPNEEGDDDMETDSSTLNGYSLLQDVVIRTAPVMGLDYLGYWDVEEAVCIAVGLIRKRPKGFEVVQMRKKGGSDPSSGSGSTSSNAKAIWGEQRGKYTKKDERNIEEIAVDVIKRHTEEQLEAIMKSYHKFKEAHSRFGSAMYPKPVKLGRKKGLPEDLMCFGIKGSRLSHRDYQASAKSLGPLAAMKKIRYLQGKLQAPKKKGKRNLRGLSNTEEAGIRTKLGRAVNTLKSMFINPNQKQLVEIGVLMIKSA